MGGTIHRLIEPAQLPSEPIGKRTLGGVAQHAAGTRIEPLLLWPAIGISVPVQQTNNAD